jgi:hypothetical protein
MSGGTAHPDSRQLPVNMAGHGVADRFYVLRDLLFASFTQTHSIGRKCGQWCFEAVSKIGRPATRSLDLLLL